MLAVETTYMPVVLAWASIVVGVSIGPGIIKAIRLTSDQRSILRHKRMVRAMRRNRS